MSAGKDLSIFILCIIDQAYHCLICVEKDGERYIRIYPHRDLYRKDSEAGSQNFSWPALQVNYGQPGKDILDPALIQRTLQSSITVLVLPEPVAMTRSAFLIRVLRKHHILLHSSS